MSTTTAAQPHIQTQPGALEVATVALLRKVGVRAPIEVVNGLAHTVPVDGPTIRVRAVGDSHVTRMIGGAHGRPAGLTSGDVLVAYYDHRPALVRQDLQLPGPGHRAVERLQSLVPGEIDLVTVEVRPGPSGRLGSAGAASQIATLGVLPAVPAHVRHIIDVDRQLAGRIQSSSVAVTGPTAGKPRTLAGGRGVKSTATEPDSNGVFTRTVQATVAVRGTEPGTGGPGGVRRMVEHLPGQSWVGLGGRIRSARVVGTESTDTGVAVTVELVIVGRKPGEGEVQ